MKKENTTPEVIKIANGVSVRGNADRFTLNWYGAMIRGCRLISHDGEKFIGYPSYKSKSGEWVKLAFIYTETEEDKKLVEKIIETLS